MKVIIGVDPHKATHTAIALDGNEGELGEIQVRANASAGRQGVGWKGALPTRCPLLARS